MRRFTPDEIRAFLQALDRHLSAEVAITIIGGLCSRARLLVTTGTVDVDTFDSDLSAYEILLKQVRSETGSFKATFPGRLRISDVLWLTSDGSLTVFLENGFYGSQPVTLSRPAPFLSSLVGAHRLRYGTVLVCSEVQHRRRATDWPCEAPNASTSPSRPRVGRREA